MTILIDPARYPAHGRLWAHLASDTALSELHAFAAGLGIPPRAFEGDHYDVPAETLPAALAGGAIAVSTRELVRRLQSAGLRTPKRRGEKVLRSGGGPDDRVDVVLSDRLPLPHGAHVLLSWDSDQLGIHRSADEGGQIRLPGATVLGFRRRWSRLGGARSLEHDGVLLVGAASTAQAGEDWSPLAATPTAWWSPLALEVLAAGPAPRR